MAEKISHDSKCPMCGKLLTKPLVEIENANLSSEEFGRFRSNVRVRYGAETKCRRCKRVWATMLEATQ